MAEEKVYGFDSRYWNGILPEGTNYEFAGIKITENTDFIPVEPVKQWKRAHRVYGLLRMPFHFWRGPKWYQEPHAHGRAQAEFFYNTLRDGEFGGKYNGMGELPPVLDLEDTNAPVGRRSIQDIKACLNQMEILFGKKPLIYTASWWFDRYITPHYSPEKFGGWNIYSYDVWNADPPPYTPVGEWGPEDIAITQYELDVQEEGFNAAIDRNQTTRGWIEGVTEEEVIYTQEELDKAVEEAVGAREQELRAEFEQTLNQAEISAWNEGLRQAQIEIEGIIK